MYFYKLLMSWVECNSFALRSKNEGISVCIFISIYGPITSINMVIVRKSLEIRVIDVIIQPGFAKKKNIII